MKNELIEHNKPNLTYSNLPEYKALANDINSLDFAIRSLTSNFISIGFYLNKIKENSLFLSLGFKDIYDFSESKYKLSKTTTKNFIAIYNRFCDKNSNCLQSKFENFSFSQLVELVSVDDNELVYYSPMQTVKEMRISKLNNTIDSDNKKLKDWFCIDLLNYLKKEYVFSSFKLSEGYKSFVIEMKYNNYSLFITLTDEDFIHLNCYSLHPIFSFKQIFSIKLIKLSINLFIKKVNEEKNLHSDFVDEKDKDKECSPTSDQEKSNCENEKCSLVVINQKLKNSEERKKFILDKSNYGLVYDLSNVRARIYQLKDIPSIYEVRCLDVNSNEWIHSEYHLVDNDSALFRNSLISLTGLIQHLTNIKF